MTRKRLIQLSLTAICLPIALYYFAPSVRGRAPAAYSLYASPPVVYTVQLEDRLVCSRTGTISIVDKRTFARRTDGSKLVSHELFLGNRLNKQRRFHMADGRYIFVDDVLGTTTTYLNPAHSGRLNVDQEVDWRPSGTILLS